MMANSYMTIKVHIMAINKQIIVRLGFDFKYNDFILVMKHTDKLVSIVINSYIYFFSMDQYFKWNGGSVSYPFYNNFLSIKSHHHP